ncbi:MAG: 30S ribosomal protein THX [Lewinellaceae bacterium]|nr:30S ribosomal protein THX [Saprospiraceae bacterium]MCB9337454.1 30S ribosomal protein THX [Lewinellaceae bacterium]
MGRGDKKTKKGKIWRGSYGKSRPKKGNQTVNQKQAEKKNA